MMRQAFRVNLHISGKNDQTGRVIRGFAEDICGENPEVRVLVRNEKESSTVGEPSDEDTDSEVQELPTERFSRNSPEDVLNDSLTTLYGLQPLTLADNGEPFIYEHLEDFAEQEKSSGSTWRGGTSDLIRLDLRAPITSSGNWALHASSIWTSSLYMATHIEDTGYRGFADAFRNRDTSGKSPSPGRLEVLELGAGAGLPGILIAKCLERMEKGGREVGLASFDWHVTLSDYPDEGLIYNLRDNAKRNGLTTYMGPAERNPHRRVRICPYGWGRDPSFILPPLQLETVTDPERPEMSDDESASGFDLIIATDTLWNKSLHDEFILTLHSLSRPTRESRIHLVAGFHTGRYAIVGFIRALSSSHRTVEGETLKLEVLHIEERLVEGRSEVRAWADEREGEDEAERRRWLAWLVIGWTGFSEPRGSEDCDEGTGSNLTASNSQHPFA